MPTPRSTDRARAEFLERDDEIAQVRTLIDRAARGVGAVLCVEGEAGIGKTAILREAEAIAARREIAVLSAKGGELERDFAHGVARQLFEAELRAATAARRRKLLSGAAGAAAPLLGLADSDPVAAGLGTDSTLVANHGLYWLTADLADERPLLLLVDDAHWADEASLQFLNYLGRRVDELAVLLVVALRPAEPGSAAELLDAVRSVEQAQTLQPAVLSEAATATLVEHGLGAAGPPELSRACREVTGGNPLLLGELLRALVADGIGPGPGAAARVRDIGPHSISRAVLGRLATLLPAAHALARAVAVLENDAELQHAARLAGLAAPDAESAADALIAAQILAPGRPLRFLHPILRQAVYLDMPEGRRRGDHARAARLLDQYGSADRAAVHLLATEPAGDAWVVERLRAAAQRDLAAGAPASAVALLARAVAEPPPTDERAAILLELGRAERIAGEPGAAEHLREALALGDEPALRASLTAELALALVAGGEAVEAAELVERVLDELDADGEEEIRLGLETVFVGVSQLSDELAGPAAVRAERLAPGLAGDTPAQRLALATASFYQTQFALGTAAELADVARRALGGGKLLSEATIDNPLVSGPINALALDAPEEAVEVLDEAIEDARARGSPLGFALASALRARLALTLGSLGPAEADARSALEAVGPSNWNDMMTPVVLGAFISVLVSRGELEDAARGLAVYDFNWQPAPTLAGTLLLRARSWLRLAQGRIDEAVTDARAALDGEWRRGGLSPRTVFGYGGLPALLAGGHLEEARTLAAEELAVAERVQAPNCIGVALSGQGLAEGGDRGIALLERAVEVLEATPGRFNLARAYVELGAALRRANRRSDARQPLEHGMDLAHECGAPPLTERARQELVACGARPRRIIRTGVDSLTPSERRVAELAAEGMSNPEIAQALFVSRRTIETHLGHVYGKLEISSRQGLAAQLSEAGT